MISVLDYILLGTILFGLVYTAAAVGLLWFRRHQARWLPANASVCPSVTVFKPLKGLDEDLESNLRTFLELDYPEFELLFGVNDGDDPAIPLVQKLCREYPQVASRLVVNERREGINPKVNNLLNMYPFARHNHFVISDSNVAVPTDYLTTLTAHMPDRSVGLVTSTVQGVRAQTLGAVFENLHLNTFVTYNVYSLLRLFRVPITIGKSMLIRRETLEAIGGFAHFRDYLMEDGLLGKAILKRGLKIATTFTPVENVNRTWSAGRFMARHMRWAIMRRHLNLGHYFAELLSNPILFAAIYALAHPTRAGLDLLVGVMLAKILLDLIAGTVAGARLPLSQYFLVPVKELIVGAIWFVPFFQRTVVWRGNRFRIGSETRVHPVTDQVAEADVTTG